MDRIPPADSHRLGGRTTTELDGPITLLVPLGSTEQHGPHLPVDTDTRIAVALSEAIAAALHEDGHDRVLVAPALAYGASGEHRGFAGTLSIGTDVLSDVLVELVRSAGEEIAEVVFVNGHGGNLRGLLRACERLEAEGRPVTVVAPDEAGDAHAGCAETSLLLHLHPALVRQDRLEVGRTEPLAVLLPRLERDGVRAVSPTGVLGDPTTASAERGRALFDALVRTMARQVAAGISDDAPS